MRLRQWLVLVCILLAGLSLRALYFSELVHQPDFWRPARDAEFHDYWARALATGDWAPPYAQRDPRIRETPFFRPPGYPYFLAMVYRLAGLGCVTPRIVQAGLGLVGGLLAFVFARRWYGAGVGLVLAALMNAYWVFIYFEGELHAPALLIVLLWAIVGVAAGWTERMSFRRAMATGGLVGLAALVRPNVLLLVPAILLWGVWIAHRRRSSRRILRIGAGLLLGTAVIVAPATVRNYVVSGECVLITSNAGINLFIGNNPRADGGAAKEIAGLGDFGTCYDYPALVENLERAQGRELTSSQVSAHFTRQALRWIAAHPLDFLRLTVRKTCLFWGPREISHDKAIRCAREDSAVLARVPVNFWFVLGACLVGVASLVGEAKGERKQARDPQVGLHKRWEVSVLLLVVVLTFFLSILPFFVSARFRVPIVPFLLLFAAYGLCRLARLAATRGKRGIALMVAALIALSWLAGRPAPVSTIELAEWHLDRGMAYHRMLRFESAAEEYARSVRCSPNDAEARYYLAYALAVQGRSDDAAAQYHEVLRIDPDHAAARRRLAVLQARGEEARADEE